MDARRVERMRRLEERVDRALESSWPNDCTEASKPLAFNADLLPYASSIAVASIWAVSVRSPNCCSLATAHPVHAYSMQDATSSRRRTN